jgi:hypothetical protein
VDEPPGAAILEFDGTPIDSEAAFVYTWLSLMTDQAERLECADPIPTPAGGIGPGYVPARAASRSDRADGTASSGTLKDPMLRTLNPSGKAVCCQ